MSAILDTIADYARERAARDREALGFDALKERCAELGRGNGEAFYSAIRAPGLRFICEIKKASPSKGVIDPVFDYLQIAGAYASAGADAVSCLTEPKWFLGSDAVFADVRGAIPLPMLRKDFTVDEYQLYQARVLGADCVLLICALLDTAVLARYLGICEALGLAALTEAHDETEIAAAVSAGARMIGVNNRNLRDFSVDFNNSSRLREHIPPGTLFVAESGVKTPADAARLRSIGADAALVGETLMRAPDKAAALAALREAAI